MSEKKTQEKIKLTANNKNYLLTTDEYNDLLAGKSVTNGGDTLNKFDKGYFYNSVAVNGQQFTAGWNYLSASMISTAIATAVIVVMYFVYSWVKSRETSTNNLESAGL